jgi:Leucine-rich repeat (LRR) protein
MPKQRPINNTHRDPRKQSDPAETSFSFEQESFLSVSYEEKAADEFHRKLAGSYRRDTSTNPVKGVSPNASYRGIWNSTSGQNGARESGSGSNSFWRGSASSNSDPSNLSSSLSNIASSLIHKDSSGIQENGSSPFARSNVDEKIKPNNPQKMETMDSAQIIQSAPQHQQSPQVHLRSQQSSLSQNSSKLKKEADQRRSKDIDVDHNDIVDEVDIGQRNQFDEGLTNHPDTPPLSISIPSTVIVNPQSQSVALRSPSGDNSNHQYHQNHLDNNIPTSIDINSGPPMPPMTSFQLKQGQSSTLDRSSSDQSTGSLLYCKTPNSTGLFGKSASLIFPTGVDAAGATVAGSGSLGVTKLIRTSTVGSIDGRDEDMNEEAAKAKRAKVEMALDQCESMRFPFKKKLILHNLKLRAADIPLQELIGTPLGNALSKLDLSGNRLGSIPARLVQNLPVLKSLDLSQCGLNALPDKWHLPKLTKLNLSQNRFTDFPEEVRT